MKRASTFSVLRETGPVLLGDAAIAWASLWFVVELRRHIPIPGTISLLPPEKFPLDPANLILTIVALLAGLGISGFYERRPSIRHRPFLLLALLIQVAIVAVGTELLVRPYPRTVMLFVPVVEALLIPLWHRLASRVFEPRARRVALVGDGESEVVGRIRRAEGLSIEALVPTVDGDLPDAMSDLIASAEEVIYVPSAGDSHLTLDLLTIRGPRGYLIVPGHGEMLLVSRPLGWVSDLPLLEVAARPAIGLDRLVKRSFDLIIATVLLIALAPLILLACALIRIIDGSPVLLRQTRVGENGRVFRMWKLRTMMNGGDDDRIAEDDDPRATSLGRVLRRHRVDELPQLINVLRGEMSLVGPRPETPEKMSSLRERIPRFDLRTFVRPGIAGLAQVAGEYDTDPDIKLRYDLSYICSWSLGVDLRILARSVVLALSGRGV